MSVVVNSRKRCDHRDQRTASVVECAVRKYDIVSLNFCMLLELCWRV